jgi:small-conductance mechanosensitive channel
VKSADGSKKPFRGRALANLLITTLLWLAHAVGTLAILYLAASLALDMLNLHTAGIVYVRGALVSVFGFLVFFRIDVAFPWVSEQASGWHKPLVVRGRQLAGAHTVAEILVFAVKAVRVSFAIVSFYVVGWYVSSLFPASLALESYDVVQGVLYALLATVTLSVVIRAVNLISAAAATRTEEWAVELEASPVENVLHVKLAQLAHSSVHVLRVLLIAVVCYGYAAFVLSQFALTTTWLKNVVELLTTPIRAVVTTVVEYLPNLFFVIVIIGVTYSVLKAVRWFAVEVRKGGITLPGFYPDWADPTHNIVRFLIIAFSVVVLFPYLPGSGSPAFQGVSIFVGVLFSLGSSGAVSNIVAGVLLTYTRAFKVGDRVKIADTMGDVIGRTLLVTRIRTPKNVEITVPNSMVLGSHIINYSSSTEKLIIHTSVTIGYDVPWKTVHQLLLSAADRTTRVLKEPHPFVLQTSLDDFYVAYELNAYTDAPNTMPATYSELHQNIQDAFNEGGVEILSPHYRGLRDGNQVTIPANYLPPDYEPPRFLVNTEEKPKK